MSKPITDYKSVIKHIYFMLVVITVVFIILFIIQQYYRTSILTKTTDIESDFKNSMTLTKSMIKLINDSKSKIVDGSSQLSQSKFESSNFEIIEKFKLVLNYHLVALQNIEYKNSQNLKINPFVLLSEITSETIRKLTEFQLFKSYKRKEFQTIVTPLLSELEKHHYFLHNLGKNNLVEIEALKNNNLILTVLLSLFSLGLASYVILKTLNILKKTFKEKEKSEKILYFSENNFREIIENVNEGILVTLDGKYVFANEAIYKLLGYEDEELIGINLDDIIHPDDLELINNYFENRMSGEIAPTKYNSTLVTKQGELISVELHPTITNWLGRKAGQILIHDIRDRKKEQQQLEDQSLIINQIRDCIVSTDLDGMIIGWNKGAEKLLGYNTIECVGRHISIIYPKEEFQYLNEIMNILKITGEHETEIKLIKKDRTVFYGHSSLSMQYDNDGNPIGMIGYTVDITGRKQAEDELALYRIELEDLVDERTLELQELVNKLQYQNLESIKAETLLIHAKHEAEVANFQKSEFINRMSHELRTPMNAILGFSQLMEIESLEPEHENYIDEILIAGRHLQEMIDEVLDLSRIESGNLKLNLTTISLSEVVLECVSLVQQSADLRRINFTNNIDDEHDLVIADYLRIKEVIVNLLTNAVKYNCENGSIIINKSLSNDLVRLSVVDTGMGINIKENENIFEPFNRLGAEFTEIQGTGIGLSIAKQLIELMDGTIGFDSAPGKGTTFWIELTAGQSNVEPILKNRKIVKVDVELKQSSIVYIEDNAANLRLIEHMLKKQKNITLLSRDNAEEGIALIRNEKPDLIILDINLPGMNGFEALKILQEDDNVKDIPVFALSAAATAYDIERGLVAGFKRYLTKPIQVSEFMSAVEFVFKPA